MHWNAGGWFGGQLGATLWMLIAGGLTAFRDFPTGLIVILLFIAVNSVGLALWVSRRFSCYASTQMLIAISGVCGMATVYLLDRAGSWEPIQTGGRISAFSSYWLIALVFGGLMLMFHLRFGLGRDKNSSGAK